MSWKRKPHKVGRRRWKANEPITAMRQTKRYKSFTALRERKRKRAQKRFDKLGENNSPFSLSLSFVEFFEFKCKGKKTWLIRIMKS